MEKKLKLMKFWLIGVFVLLAAGLFILYWLFGTAAAAASPVMVALKSVWPYWLGMIVLFITVYFIYKAIVSKKK
jgi:hypothetical protein